ncbi:MAG TPA: ATP-binding protein [Caulobacteraceae bacterium]|jgi:signal transduction histidine kinase|nr:ATP-binding protein [Caulobacteraceae bacterium]
MNLRRLRLPFLPTATLFAQLLALIVLSLLAAVAVNVLVIFNLPPPAPDFYRISEITEAIRGQPVISTGLDRLPLVSQIRDQPPQIDASNPRFMFGFRHDLGAVLGIPPQDIVISSDFFGFPDRRIFQAVRREISRGGARTADERYLVAPFELGVKQPDGRWLIIKPKPSLKPTPWQQMTFTWVVLSTLALSPIAYLFARRLASPIAQFAAAAERLGRDPHAPPLIIRGPAEIAVAVQAFNGMQERLGRYVDDRTAMIGAVAHDLRTPLMRLRFRAEAAPEELRAKIAADIAEMEAMISGTMAFVRDASQQAERTRLELSSLLESLADEMNETGQDVVVEQADRIVIDGDPLALRRLFNNLLENAVKFGRLARIRVFTDHENAVVEIDDKGPGLPPSELEQVFEPFYRREGSRSRETGGIGLGLAVVRSVARAHGGDAGLENRLGGGLTARVHLPLSAV